MKKIIQTISRVVQVVLLAPVKLPGKALHIVKCIAFGIDLLDSMLQDAAATEQHQPKVKGDDVAKPE